VVREGDYFKAHISTFEHFSWQEGYGGFTVSKSLVAAAAYIAGQKEHHQKQDFQSEFLELLRRHGIEFDENEVFRSASSALRAEEEEKERGSGQAGHQGLEVPGNCRAPSGRRRKKRREEGVSPGTRDLKFPGNCRAPSGRRRKKRREEGVSPGTRDLKFPGNCRAPSGRRRKKRREEGGSPATRDLKFPGNCRAPSGGRRKKRRKEVATLFVGVSPGHPIESPTPGRFEL
jgi:hypothetical protein